MHAASKSKLTRRKPSFACCSALCAVLAPVLAWPSDTHTDQDLSTIVITATRKPTLIKDEPVRVEAVPAEEIEENLTVQPGNL